MKLYIYEDEWPVSHSYHGGGGIVIITDREPLEAWLAFTKNDEELATTLGDPDLVFEVESEEERVIVFPDAGCC